MSDGPARCFVYLLLRIERGGAESGAIGTIERIGTGQRRDFSSLPELLELLKQWHGESNIGPRIVSGNETAAASPPEKNESTREAMRLHGESLTSAAAADTDFQASLPMQPRMP